MNAASLNIELIDLYRKWLSPLLTRMPEGQGLAGPHLLCVPDSYTTLKHRLLIVGQQTYDWCNWDSLRQMTVDCAIAEALSVYSSFNLGEKYTRSPFWQAARKFQAALNPQSDTFGYVWTNLVKFDQVNNGHDRPTQEVESMICEHSPLPSEIQILEPDVVIFFTGPAYDDRLQSTFPGVGFEDCVSDGFIHRLCHSRLPKHTYRTYHPAYLRRRRKWSLLKNVATLILETT